MNKTKKLGKPFYDVLWRALPSTSRLEVSNYNYDFTRRIRFRDSSFSSCVKDSNLCGRRLLVYGNVRFCGRTFCSKEADDTVNGATCWKCNEAPKTVPFLFCESCRSVQPPDQSVDYFQIFGLEKGYGLEGEDLEGKYKDWQKKLHPDLVHSKSEKEREYAAEQSARVNEAYRTLIDPLSRAIYILRLEDVDVNEEETVSEPGLLTEIMEIREAVEDAADSEALRQIESLTQEKLKHWSNSFADAFRNRKFDEARICIRRMTYYHRVNEEIAKKL